MPSERCSRRSRGVIAGSCGGTGVPETWPTGSPCATGSPTGRPFAGSRPRIALRDLPRISQAFASGDLSVDKVVELCRFATPETEKRLLAWAGGVSCAAIRRRGDLVAAGSIEETVDAERARFVPGGGPTTAGASGSPRSFPRPRGRWWHGRSDERPSECLRCREKTMPPVPRPDGPMPWWHCALLAWESDPDPDRATVVVHAPLASLETGRGGASLVDGGVAHPETARRLGCDARIQTVIEDEHGQPLALGRISREPSAAMVRQLRYRDTECRFPGCGARQFTQAHHIVWWKRGGTTDLANLVLICTFHHKLVHEHGWGLRREPSGEVRWFRPGGCSYHAGPDPPRQEVLGA